MRCFTKLELSKSQADSLLKQLATDWDEHYDTIAELIALQMSVYIDETGWKVGTKSCDTWVCSTTMHVLFRCGVSRAKTEAAAVLGASFAGIGVTDDYAAYKSLFTQHQLCWAHLIRKAITLALAAPRSPGICDVPRRVVRDVSPDAASSTRRSTERRSREKAEQLLDRIRPLWRASWRADRSGRDPTARGRLPPLAERVDGQPRLPVRVRRASDGRGHEQSPRTKCAPRSRSPQRSPHQQDGRRSPATRCDPHGAGLAGHPLPAIHTGQSPVRSNPLVEDRLVHLPAGTRRLHQPNAPPTLPAET